MCGRILSTGRISRSQLSQGLPPAEVNVVLVFYWDAKRRLVNHPRATLGTELEIEAS